jgi:hypothetical protein
MTFFHSSARTRPPRTAIRAAFIVSAAALLAGLDAAAPVLAYQAQSDCDRPPRQLTFGARESCRLRSEDPTMPERGTHYQDWSISLNRGQSVQIDLESNDFDSYLQVLGPSQAEPLADNDDRGGGSLNSRIFFTAPMTGQFTIRATRLYGTEGGSYTLSVGAPIEAREPLAINDRAEGRIAEGDSVGPGPGGTIRFDAYSFDAAIGERIRIDLTSNDFDARLVVVNAAGDIVASDDDGGGNRNARVLLAPPAGRYTVRAGSRPDQSGAYVLAVQRSTSPPRAQPVTATSGMNHSASLTLQSMADTSTRGRITGFYDLYSLALRPGQVVTVEAQSSDFTPILAAGVESFFGFARVEESRSFARRPAHVVLRPTRPGTALIKVLSVGAGVGAYTLTITAAPPAEPSPAP